MPNASTVNNGRAIAADLRWQSRVGRIMDVIAILQDIQEHRNFIESHALHAHPLEVAVNLRRIFEESEGMSRHIERIRMRLYELRALAEDDIYRSWETNREREPVPMAKKENGSTKQTTKIKTKPISKPRPRPKYRGGRVKAG